MEDKEVIEYIKKMILELTGEKDLVDARIKSLQLYRETAFLIPSEIAFSYGSASQTGILFGILKQFGEWEENGN